MTLHVKVGDAWVECQRPYVLSNGVWVAANEAWVKSGGTWVQAYDYDVTPPDPPIVGLTIEEDFVTINGVSTLKTRFIRVSHSMPGPHDPDLKMVRMLTTYNGKAPTTQFGGTYTEAPDNSHPEEPWSDTMYNAFGKHKDTSKVVSKQWPRNASAGTIIKDDETYFFGAWALDNSGNWSPSTQAQIYVPKKSVNVPNIITQEARFQPVYSGTWRSGGFSNGKLIQQKSPRCQGIWFYGNQINAAVGKYTQADEKVKIKKAQVYIERENDGGQANANIYLYWAAYQVASGLPAPGTSLNRHEITKLGQLAKGQGKWFDIPAAYYGDFNKNMGSLGLDWKDPDKADGFPSDFSQVVGTGSNPRSGEIHLVWEEEL